MQYSLLRSQHRYIHRNGLEQGSNPLACWHPKAPSTSDQFLVDIVRREGVAFGGSKTIGPSGERLQQWSGTLLLSSGWTKLGIRHWSCLLIVSCCPCSGRRGRPRRVAMDGECWWGATQCWSYRTGVFLYAIRSLQGSMSHASRSIYELDFAKPYKLRTALMTMQGPDL
jgi:hypothetical protein